MAPVDNSTLKHVKQIYVEISDILQGLKENGPEGPSYQVSVLKITPPFGGEHKAEFDRVGECPSHLPDLSSEPAYIEPVFFVGYEVGDGPVTETDIEVPTKESAAKIARQKDYNTSIEDEVEHQYGILVSMWKERIKNELRDEVRIAHDPETGEEAWAEVKYEPS